MIFNYRFDQTKGGELWLCYLKIDSMRSLASWRILFYSPGMGHIQILKRISTSDCPLPGHEQVKKTRFHRTL